MSKERKDDKTKSAKTKAPDLLNQLEGYENLLQQLKDRVRRSQVKAALAVNSELISLYWELGKSIVERQERAGWGDGVLDRLSNDLAVAFPEMKGFSRRNLYRIRALYQAYRAESEFVPQAVAQIPWGHNILILEKVKEPSERRWYVAKTTEHGWSRSICKFQKYLSHKFQSYLSHLAIEPVPKRQTGWHSDK